jgi:hypothetical protein
MPVPDVILSEAKDRFAGRVEGVLPWRRISSYLADRSFASLRMTVKGGR